MILTSPLHDHLGLEPYPVKKNESYMNKAQKDYFLHFLQQWRLHLLNEAHKTIDQFQKDQDASDVADHACQAYSTAHLQRFRDRERRLLKKIDASIMQIQESNSAFGFCQGCESPIGLDRLSVRPIAAYCIDCKSSQEIIENKS